MYIVQSLLISFFLIASISVFVDEAQARKKSSDPVYRKSFEDYSLKKLVKAKTAEAKSLKGALEEGEVLIEYTYSKKKISGDKHGLVGLEAVVMREVSDNFVEEPIAHFIPSEKAGARICSIEGHRGYYGTRVEIQQKNRPSYLIMMSDKFNQRILAKDLDKNRTKGSKVDPNYAAQILISKSFIKSVEALCTD